MALTGARGPAHGARSDGRAPTVRELLAPPRVKVPLVGRDKEAVLDELVELVVRCERLEGEHEAIRDAVRERERVLSTGIGDGVAIPHAKYDGLRDIVMAAGVSRDALEYGALDGRPVRLFFLILGPGSAAGLQVRILSRIGRLMRDGRLRAQLEAAADAGRFLQVLEEAETAG